MKKIFVVIMVTLMIPLVNALPSLEVTPEHPFLIDNEWIPASELKVGDTIRTIQGEQAIIKKIKRIKLDKPVTVYNFEDDHALHNYVVGEGLIVHNSFDPSDTQGIGAIDSKSLGMLTMLFGPKQTARQKMGGGEIHGRELFIGDGDQIDGKLYLGKQDHEMISYLSQMKENTERIRKVDDNTKDQIVNYVKNNYPGKEKEIEDIMTIIKNADRALEKTDIKIIAKKLGFTRELIKIDDSTLLIKKHANELLASEQAKVIQQIGSLAGDQIRELFALAAIKAGSQSRNPKKDFDTIRKIEMENSKQFANENRGSKVPLENAFSSKAAVCRHRSSLLVAVLQRLIDAGILDGKAEFQFRPGHVMVEYKSASNKKYIFDPMNRIALVPDSKAPNLKSTVKLLEENDWDVYDADKYQDCTPDFFKDE